MPIYMKLEGIKGTVQPAAGDHVPTEQFALNFTKVQVESARTGGVNFQLGDGSVRIARDGDDSFDFKPGDGSVMPGDGSVMPGDGSVKVGDGSVMPQDEAGIIAILIGLLDERADGGERAGDGSVMPDDFGGRESVIASAADLLDVYT